MKTIQSLPSCTQTQRTITEHDLPLSCPLPDQKLWNAHPRVYLPIEETHKEICPYCGTIYVFNPSKS